MAYQDGVPVYEYYFPESVNAKVPFMIQTLGIIWGFQILFSVLTVTNFRKRKSKKKPPTELFLNPHHLMPPTYEE